MLLLAALPVIAYAPAWTDARLLGPGDGSFLHFPLRAAVWQAYRDGDVPGWNPGLFLGTPLLAAYRPGAFYPVMAALVGLRDFDAFQVLVLLSLSAAAVLTFLYVRRLGGERVGAFVAGVCFCLGPYLVNHLGDTATVVAAPLLLLVLLAAESHLNRKSPVRAAGLAAALALLFLAGSPEASRAGAALVAGRLLVGHVLLRSPRGPGVRDSVLALGAGALLAAPQLLPSLLLVPDAGRSVSALAPAASPLPGFFGLVLRYASHTPAPSLVVAALPLSLSLVPVRVLGLALLICLGLQWGRGPLAAPGALALVFDLTVCVLAGLSLSAQWRARGEPEGRRLRAYFLVASLASAAALSVAAAALGPLPEVLAGPVGVLALSLIFYFSLASSPRPLRAAVWLLPLTVSFLLQPHARGAWEGALRRRELIVGSPTRAALEGAMGGRRGERTLTLTRAWPRPEQVDLAYGNVGLLTGRRTANGYDPLTPLRGRVALGGMSVAGVLPAPFFRTDPARLELLGIRWVQVPTSALRQEDGWGDPLDMPLVEGQPRFFPLPISAASEVRLVSSLAEAVEVPEGYPVARVRARLASGRSLDMVVHAGAHTAEWAWDRADVSRRVAHRRAPIFEAWPGPGGAFQGLRYMGRLELPGRFMLDGLTLERLPGVGRLTVYRLALYDQATETLRAITLPAGYVSDRGRFLEVATTPDVRLFEVPGATTARVVAGVKVLPTQAAVAQALGALEREGVDHRRTALAAAPHAELLALPPGHAGPAEVLRASKGGMDVRAEGPGLLVLAELNDRGWKARVDGRPARIHRVNLSQMGVVLGPGIHRVLLRYEVPGLREGVVLAALAAAGLFLWLRGRVRHG
jgi:hypothetical protein